MDELSLPENHFPERFQLERALGQGSFGKTYLAFDSESELPCVVKQLSFRHLQNWKAYELFEREAKVLELLDHPRIPRFLGFYSQADAGDQQAYLVQGYIPGQTLTAAVEAGKRFREPEIVAIAEKMLELLDYLHSFSPPVIHRDIKPDNLILSPEGEPYLVDFGAVNAQLHSAGSTIVGTFGYMPPEQLDGRAVPASDLFGLGATLIYALTGLEPGLIEKENLSLNFRPHVQISEGLAQWLETLTQADWKKRFQSAAEALSALQQRHSLRPPQGPLQARNKLKGPLTALGLAGLVGLALLVFKPALPADSVKGRLSYAGGQALPAITPRFWLRDEVSRQRVKPIVNYSQGQFEIRGLPPGKYGLNVTYDANPSNPIQYPGDLRAWSVFEIKAGQPPPELGMALVKLIHLRSPVDNNRPLPGWEQPCGAGSQLPADVSFVWDSLGGAGQGVRYNYQIQEWACSATAQAPQKVLNQGNTEQNKLSLQLPANATGHYYRFVLEAWQGGQNIGRLRTHGSQDHDWDFVFVR